MPGAPGGAAPSVRSRALGGAGAVAGDGSAARRRPAHRAEVGLRPIGYIRGMPFTTMISKFARSSKGRRLAEQAMTYAKSPDGKRKIAQAREQLASRRRPKRP
jgi:hypothetical protein